MEQRASKSKFESNLTTVNLAPKVDTVAVPAWSFDMSGAPAPKVDTVAVAEIPWSFDVTGAPAGAEAAVVLPASLLQAVVAVAPATTAAFSTASRVNSPGVKTREEIIQEAEKKIMIAQAGWALRDSSEQAQQNPVRRI